MKNTLKRTLCMLLALIMAFSLAGPAYAAGLPAGEGDLTVEQPSVQPKDEIISDGEPIPVAEPEEPGEPAEEPATEPVELPGASKLITDMTEEGKIEGSFESREDPFGAEDIQLDEPENLFTEKTFTFSDENGFAVEVFAPEGALPNGTEMHVARLADLAPVQTAVDNAENLNGNVQLAADISFMFDGQEIEPAEGAKLVVKMSAPEIEGIAAPVVIHIPDGENAVPEIVEQLSVGDLTVADTVSFEASNFSVYAVLEPQEEGEEARVTVNFYKGDTLVTTVYVKNSDELLAEGEEHQTGHSYINDIVYDPGIGETLAEGQLFKGWSMDVSGLTNQPENASDYVGNAYTSTTKGLTISEIRTFLDGLEIVEGDVLNIYAIIFKVYHISYEDSKGITLASDIVTFALNEQSAYYTITQTYSPSAQDDHFDGWNVKSGADAISDAKVKDEDGQYTVSATAPYPQGTRMLVSGNVIFSTKISKGHWLVYEENLYNATYNAPVFIYEGEKAKAPKLEMKCNGYTFEGWYKLKAGVKIDDVPKDADKNYIISDTYFEEYTFDENGEGDVLLDKLVIYAKWTAADTAKYTVIVWKQSVNDDKAAADSAKTYDFAFSVQIDAASNTAVSALDLSAYENKDGGSITANGKTYSFAGFEYNANQKKSNYDVVKPNSTTVINLYYDRELVTYRYFLYRGQHYEYSLTTRTGEGTYYLPNGNGGYTSTYLYYNDGKYYRNRTWFFGYSYSNEYTGDRYDRSTIAGGYAVDESRTQTGLYGQRLSRYNYTWSTDYRWYYEDQNNPGNPSSTSFTSIEELFKSDTDFYGDTEEFNANVYHILQNVDGSWPTNATYTVATNTNSYMSFKSFFGFSSYQFRIKIANGTTNYWYGEYSSFNNQYPYRTDSNGWTAWLDPGNAVISQNYNSVYTNDTSTSGELWHATTGGIQMRYTRDKFDLTYMVGRFVDRDGAALNGGMSGTLKTIEDIPYEDNLGSYATYTPAERNDFYFVGWYLDETCTTAVDFATTKMPMNGLTVYGKWQQTEYRVFLHPNALIDGVRDTTLDWGSETQAMNFRIAYNNKVSIPTGLRTGYEFGGWFTDEEFTDPYNADTRLTEVTVPTTPAYDKTTDFTDGANDVEMDKWGLIPDGATPINKDVNRPWITRKLDLYCRWSQVLDGAEGIGIIYDATADGKDPPSDTLLYQDNVRAVAQAASKAKADDMQFDYWVLQKWNESKGEYEDVEGTHFYPGETFPVLAANARKVARTNEDGTPMLDNDGKQLYTYTVQLRASYVKKDAPKPTHITWYSNIYDCAGNTIPDIADRLTATTPAPVGDKAYVKTVADDGSVSFEIDEIQINKAIPIPAGNTFVMEGYTFLGWGRVNVAQTGTTATDPDGNVIPMRAEAGVTDPKDLTEDDLFLKWNADDGKYYVKDSDAKAGEDAWTRVAIGVAADENNPYHDLYAIWSGTFQVVYTGQDDAVDKAETYYITKSNKEFNLLVKHTVSDADPTQAVASTESALHAGYLYGGYYASAVTSTAAYNGSNWTFSEPQDIDAAAMRPVGGATYYIKEVPGNLGTLNNTDFKDFLAPKMTYTYYKQGDGKTFDKMGGIFLVSMIDDQVGTAYQETGFIIGNTRYQANTAASLTITARDDTTQSKTYTATGTNAQISSLQVYNRNTREADPSKILNEGDLVKQYWITNDNYLVIGYTVRAYKNFDNAEKKVDPDTVVTGYTAPVWLTVTWTPGETWVPPTE